VKDTILIVEDETDLLKGLQRTVSMAVDCDVLVADNSYDALKLIKSEPVDVVLSDICMPRMDGLSLLRAVREYDPHITVIMMTAYGTIEVAVKAIKAGAYDFIQKPFEEEQLIHLLRKGLELNRLVRENARLMAQVCDKAPFESIVGNSTVIQQALETIQTLSQTDVTVLILGETGTGKDLAAHAIHAASKRRHRQMVTVNCPAVPESILESELFGYKKGAFTNADQDKPGLFDKADGGTIFLDEIGDLSPPVQTKLLRVLEDKSFKPLGDSQDRKVDVRIIAATNQDLETKIEENSFRPDLYYRLNVAALVMPPLREFKEDIPVLADHFLKKSACEMNKIPKQISPDVIAYLLSRDWPGNVRELENTIKNWTAICSGNKIEMADIPGQSGNGPMASGQLDFSLSYKNLKNNAIETFTKGYLHRLLEHTGGNVSLSAQISGIKRQSLQKIIKRYAIKVDRYRS